MSDEMALGTWSGWAGEPDSWPVTSAGRRVLDWALDVHREFYSDAWLTKVMDKGTHPLMSLHEWPLSQPRTLPGLIERAARLALLDVQDRDFLQQEIRCQFTVSDFDHLDLLLETAGLGIRGGSSVEADVLLPSGKRPDLRLSAADDACCIEVTRMTMDREMQNVSAFSSRLGDHLMRLHFRLGVNFEASAEEALEEVETHEVLEALTLLATNLHWEGQRSVWERYGVHVTAWLGGASALNFAGPLMGGDAYARLSRRLLTKAVQTRGGPRAWIRADEVGGMFMLTDWAQRPRELQLTQLRSNLLFTLQDEPHVLGVVLTAGAAPGGGPGIDARFLSGEGTGEVPAAAIDRTLPGGRVRSSFVVGIHPVAGPYSVENVANWYRNEPSWLDWALAELGHPGLAELVPLPQ